MPTVLRLPLTQRFHARISRVVRWRERKGHKKIDVFRREPDAIGRKCINVTGVRALASRYSWTTRGVTWPSVARAVKMTAVPIALSLGLFVAAVSALAAKTANASKICSGIEAGGLHTMRFHLGRVRNETGHWTTTISAIKDHEEVTDMMDLEMLHTVTECSGKKIFHVQGTFHENPAVDPVITVDGRIIDKLRFHNMGGKNTYFVNDYRTAFRPNDGENNGVVFTKHHLKRNQLFEVQIERPTTKFPYGLGIGLTSNDPNLLTIPDHMNTLKSGTWMYYDRRLFNNSTLVQKDIGRNLDELQRGDQLGIIIKDPGILHVYINGNDMGPGMAGIPLEVYGVVELRGKTVQVSIIEKHAKLISIH